MPKLEIKKGTTSKLVEIGVLDSSSSVGAGLTGLVYNSAGLTAYYYRSGAASAVAITLATMTLGTWATGGFIVIDGTNMPGDYQLAIPDAALATGADQVIIHLKGATNMAPVRLEIQLVDNVEKDSYDIANHATYGNAKLVRSTTPANTLDVDANNRAEALLGATTHTGAVIPWNTAWDAEVQSEVDDALNTAISELGVAAPTATPTIRTGIMLLYMALRNKLDVQTSGTDALEIHNDSGTLITSKLLTDDGSDYSEAKMT